MSEASLRDRRILIVEDEYMLAEELCNEIQNAGAIVVGPAGTIDNALDLIRTEDWIDGAILDVNLRGEMVFAAADLLTARNVPFIFTTGYDPTIIPSQFSGAIRCEKPVDASKVKDAIAGLLQA